MKKGLWISAAVIGIVAASYPGLAWVSGKVVEARIEDYRKRMLEQMPYLTVADRIYQRGVYRSREEITYEFGRRAFESVAAARPDAGSAAAIAKALRFTVRSDIRHGPFPGLGHPALAIIETEFVLSQAAERELAKTFGAQKPIVIVTRVNFDGGGRTTVTSPAFAGLDLGKSEKLSWRGLTASIEFGRDLAWFKLQGAAPGFAIDSPRGETLKLDDVVFESDTQLAFGDLYVGGGSVKIKSMRIGTPAPEPSAEANPENGTQSPATEPPVAAETLLEGLEYAAHFDRRDDFLDLTGRLTAARLEASTFKVQDARYQITFKHLHGPSVAGLVRLIRMSFAEGPPAPTGDKSFETEAKRLGTEILKREPELVIDQLSFAVPEGDARMSGSARIIGFEPSDLDGGAGVAALARKMDARIDISVAEGLLAAEAEGAAAGDEGSKRFAMIEQRLTELEAQGYVTRTNGRLVTRIEFRNGQLTFNGKPYVPPPSAPPPVEKGKPPRDTTHT
jgi:uncharacterized protein YdgA (DUF945 family)